MMTMIIIISSSIIIIIIIIVIVIVIVITIIIIIIIIIARNLSTTSWAWASRPSRRRWRPTGALSRIIGYVYSYPLASLYAAHTSNAKCTPS
jgi:hypothetical protein